MKKYYLLLISIFLISGCTTREYYHPSASVLSNTEIDISDKLPAKIKFFTKKEATLENSQVVPDNKILKKGFVALDKELSKKANILLINNKEIKFDKLIVQAAKNANLLVVLFSDNSVEFYDLNKNKAIFSYKFGDSLALRKFVAAPIFYKDLVIVPTLDGKLAIFNSKTNKIIRDIVISKKDYFSNIIFLDVIQDTLIAASRDTIISISPGVFSQKSYNIKHIIATKNNLYIFTIEGYIKKLNLQLKELASIELSFANIIAPTVVNNYIYFIEYGDGTYLVKLDMNLKKLKVYPLSGPDVEDVNVFAKDGLLYAGDRYINLKSVK
jgi:outer membrane protein assembly factor BamB